MCGKNRWCVEPSLGGFGIGDEGLTALEYCPTLQVPEIDALLQDELVVAVGGEPPNLAAWFCRHSWEPCSLHLTGMLYLVTATIDSALTHYTNVFSPKVDDDDDTQEEKDDASKVNCSEMDYR
ncbi:hypothetical protein Cni_G29085 [Canna indica]|uniref:Uncharacterized protein n=1 Tax=Canna indica TaxID=4628 RepID=A0AAQ3QSW9_9LILI|nr:hypothetical protein Cni_G29085 [Canna indica]